MPPQTKRPNKRLLQGERSREEILDAAGRIMSAHGFDGTSIADIAHESGLPNSSIYWHFHSKAGILAAVMERGAERFFAAAAPVEPEPDETPAAYLRRALRSSSAAFVERPEFLRLFILLLLSNDNEDIRTIVERVREQGRESLHELLTNAYGSYGPAAAKKVADSTVDFAMAGFDGAFLALQSSRPISHRAFMDQLAQAVAALGDAILDGLQVHQRPSP